jgi:hypothetical protein
LCVLTTALTITAATTSTTTAMAASIWWRVVAGLRLFVLIWSDFCWVRSVRVSHHGIRRAWLLLLLDLLGVVGGSGSSTLLGRLSVVRLLSLWGLLKPRSASMAGVAPVSPCEGTGPGVGWRTARGAARRAVVTMSVTTTGSVVGRATGTVMGRTSRTSRTVARWASGEDLSRVEEREASEELGRRSVVVVSIHAGTSIIGVEVADEVPKRVRLMVSHDGGKLINLMY